MHDLEIIRPEELIVAEKPVPGGSGDATAEDKAHLRHYLRSLRRHQWLILGLCLLATMLAAIYMARKPDVYEAEALVMVDLEEINPELWADSKIIVNSPVNDPAHFNTQLRILGSPGLLRRVVKSLDLEHHRSFLQTRDAQVHSTWQNLLRMAGMGRAPREEDFAGVQVLPPAPGPADGSKIDMAEAKRLAPLVERILDELQVEPVIERRMGYAKDNTRLIEVRYKHHDPMITAKVVNTIADIFALANLERKAEANITAGDFLQKRVAELQAHIRKGEERLIDYAKSNQILSLEPSQNTVVERLVGLTRQLLEAENERKLAESAYRAALAPGAAGALAEERVARQVADLDARLAQLRQKRAQLLVNNTEEWPEYKETEQEIRALEKEVEAVRKRSVGVELTYLETKFRQAMAREQALRETFEAQRAETLAQNEAAINYRIIQQEIQTNKNMLDGLLQRYKENDVVVAGMRNNIHVIDYAVAPDQPVSPRRWRGVALAFVFSLSFGVFLALLLDYLNDTVRSTADVERLLHLPVLATVPAVKGTRGGGSRPALLITGNARPLLAEAYRTLRTSVLLSFPGRTPKTLLVTSSLPTEGKTTTAINLAVSLAQTEAAVLIIDADLRHPSSTSIFGLEGRPGLSTYLSRKMSEAELLSMVEKHPASNLYILPAGPVPPNPAELLGSEMTRKLLATLEPTFAYIVLDSPPVASLTDAVLLSSVVDGVLLVAHCGKSPVDILRRARQVLVGAGAKILGVVLNQVNMRSQDDYYGGYYALPYYEGNGNDSSPADSAAPADLVDGAGPVAEADLPDPPATPASAGRKVDTSEI